jgi:hypothetical protein
MTNEERDLITQFIQRVGGAPSASSSGFGGSVPATTTGQPPLPPVDRDADALIADLFTRYPEARYRITQLAFVEEHALVEAQNRISQLTQALQQARGQQAAPPPGAPGSPWGGGAQAQPQPAPQQSRGFFGSLFGGGSQAQQAPQYQQSAPQYAPPPPQYAPGYQPGMFQRGGSGFLGSALTTAAGVAGGMVAGNALMNLFEGGHEGVGGGGFGGMAGGLGGAGVAAASPWAAPVSDPYNLGGAPKDDPSAGQLADNSAWTTPDQGQGGGWQDASQSGGGGWTDASQDQGGGGWTDASNDPAGGDPGWTDGGSDDQNV